LLLALGVGQRLLAQAAAAQAKATVQAPVFEVDPFWPKPMPNNWVLGQAIGLTVDDRDHVWIVHRGSDTLANNERGLELKSAECCAGAPPVLEFDASGALVGSWAVRATATTGRPPTTASSSIARAMCGLAATGPATRTS